MSELERALRHPSIHHVDMYDGDHHHDTNVERLPNIIAGFAWKAASSVCWVCQGKARLLTLYFQ